MKYLYKDLLNTKRLKKTTIQRSKTIDEFNSDRSRIIYCSSFRRLLQKAQVFSLEPNASVRTRLTHSLEVADLGRSIATKIAYKLSSDKQLPDRSIQSFVTIVENACLLHDIGNPPFGHFGEAAIIDWAKNFTIKNSNINQNLFNTLLSDFREFDGNPQGFRTITKLHTERDQYSLNLTYATLLCTLKYSRAASEEPGTGITKKAGYFLTEKDVVETLWEETHIKEHSRYPLTYIMEAADDIAYCMSDIADGIEKKILTCDSFVEAFKDEWKSTYGDLNIPVELPTRKEASFNHNISIPWSKKAMDEAVDVYFSNHEKVYEGKFDSLISEDNPMGKVLDTIKKVSRKKLYTSSEAESIELTGYAVITGILHRYERLLKLDKDAFQEIVNGNLPKGYDIERRLFNRLGKRYVDAYKFATAEYNHQNSEYETYELWLRIHLIVDHISGMTDEYALETYQALEGINLTTL